MPAIFGGSVAHKPQVVPSSTVADINNLASNIIILSVFIIRTSVKLFPAPNSKAFSLGILLPRVGAVNHAYETSILTPFYFSINQLRNSIPGTKDHGLGRLRIIKKQISFVLDTG